MTAPATAPMTAPATAPRIAVVGAGAAGIGAGMALAERGVPFVILEAQDRVGGRAFTDAASLPAPWDHGCGWLHNADVNPLTAEAERRGIDILREVRDAYFMLHEHGAWRDDAETQAARDALAETFGALAEAARDGADRAAAELLDPQAPFARSVRYVLALVEAEDPERVSCAATLDYADNGVNWRALDGYGALVAHLAEGLPIRTGVAASRVAHEGGGVRLTTSAGDLQVEAALVTASANVLLEGGIEIGPGPAREALDLMQAAPCGVYEKIAVALRALPFDDPRKLFCTILPDGAPGLQFQVQRPTRPGRAPLMIAHVAGDQARALNAETPEARRAFAVEVLAHGFGSGVRREVLGAAVTGWAESPWTRGAYSHAAPGRAQDRRELIARDTGPIAFAGEALSLHAQGTCHGAWLSGRAAAMRLAEALPAA